jgi:hypothetical protein
MISHGPQFRPIGALLGGLSKSATPFMSVWSSADLPFSVRCALPLTCISYIRLTIISVNDGFREPIIIVFRGTTVINSDYELNYVISTKQDETNNRPNDGSTKCRTILPLWLPRDFNQISISPYDPPVTLIRANSFQTQCILITTAQFLPLCTPMGYDTHILNMRSLQFCMPPRPWCSVTADCIPLLQSWLLAHHCTYFDLYFSNKLCQLLRPKFHGIYAYQLATLRHEPLFRISTEFDLTFALSG